jgi:hypothetical protein
MPGNSGMLQVQSWITRASAALQAIDRLKVLQSFAVRQSAEGILFERTLIIALLKTPMSY